MKINDYVRDYSGNIFRIKSIDNDIYIIEENDEELKVSLEELDPYKCSDKPIKLVECGDYVNGMKVVSIGYDPVTEDYSCGDFVYGYDESGFEGEQRYYNEEIQSIVTKEKFEAIENHIKR